MKKTRTRALLLLSCLSLYSNFTGATATQPLNKFSDNILLVTALTSGDIIKYLQDDGFTVETTPVQSNNDWSCNTSKGSYHYFTVVHTDGTDIIVHEDIRL
jgi:hypothetical protein